ncbi:PAS domain-containing protein [Thalassotalea sp. LPB0316]|uniref:PAS domain-containing protein n=1 Tax=Thalassotalea sp. LPB0316 TaxID=2769490 RepID=UPI001867B1AA|nr:PAS domain-containing protein [Thalassotalea sp. LPB0316]QOL25690.1 PAS domain-containing protein [Thalassotalea sp. LPB0316]
MARSSIHQSSLFGTEVTFAESEQLISTTDTLGHITYVNSAFCQVSGYSKDELIGQHHNIIRHPDMLKATFKDMWQKLKQGESWRGMVKNQCKNGDYYWADTCVTPLLKSGKVVGYQSVRMAPSKEMKDRANTLYQQLLSGKKFHEPCLNYRLKHILSAALVIANLSFIAVKSNDLTIVIAVIALLASLLFIYKLEFLTLPPYIKELKRTIDSPSRLIYSGKGGVSLLQYPLVLCSAKHRTMLAHNRDSNPDLS